MPAVPGARGRTAVLAALLVASGAAALLHETAWFRLLAPVVGVGALPSAVVAAGALLGIAAGSALGGLRADRAARPSRVLALAETAAAALGLLVPPALSLLGGLPGPAALAAATATLALAALPWGVSIPAAFRVLAPEEAGTGDAFRRLYAWNTLGALLGIAAGAAFLLEALGNRGAVAVASGLQGLAALAALLLVPAAGPADAGAPGLRPGRPATVPLALLAAAALAGAAGVGAQVAWMRRLTPVLCATFPVFAAVLAVHVGGIAMGTALFGPRRGDRPGRSAAILALAAGAGTVVALPLLGPVVEAVRPLWWEGWGDPLRMLGMRVAVAAVLVLPGVVAGSALLPWIVRAAAPGPAAAGRGSGRLLAANAAGAAAGGLAAALWLVPAAGTAGCLVLCAAALLLAGGLVAGGGARAARACAAAGLGVLPVLRLPGDAAGVAAVGAFFSKSAYLPGDTVTLLAADGRNASVLVRDREGRLEFWVEGSLESSNWPTDRLHLGLLGHLPLLLFEARADRPARVALVGLGAGFTARAAALHRPADLAIYELEPEVVRASELFRPLGGGVPASASVVFGDGRRAILAEEGSVDVLSSDPVHPAVAGSAFLYAAEYYRGAVRRLSPEGILVQWLPVYQLHPEDLRLALRTFSESVPFPYVFLAGPDALLVGSRTPLRLSHRRLARALASEAAAPLRAQGLGSPGALLSLLVLDPAGCRAVAGPGDLNTDDRLLLELRAGWREAGDQSAALGLLTSRPADPRTLLDGPPGAGFGEEVAGGARLRAALEAWVRGSLAGALGLFEGLVEDDPSNEFARLMRDEAAVERAWELLDRGHAPSAARLAREVAGREGSEPLRRLDAAAILLQAGAPAEARAIALPYALRHPWPRARRLAGGGDLRR